MIPRQILDIIDRYPEDHYSFHITKIESVNEMVILGLSLTAHEWEADPFLQQDWIVEIGGYINSNIKLTSVDWIQLKTEHPLLWEYTDIYCELYFSGQSQSPEKIFQSLYQTHETLFKGRLPFYYYLNRSVLENNFAYSNGQLAKGPNKVLYEYGLCLQQHSMNFSLVGGRHPSNDGGQPAILLLGRDCHIIAEVFKFTLASGE
ncbi:MAG TPA: hypothetical protein VHM26_01620 [Chitinophagaceae bacterium]|jgi:hypothetical protein|nr:hypothetical protein [Chitinophagaceae bacterium]